jgi:hypothetical protein
MLVLTENAALFKHHVYQAGFAVVYVGNNSNITNVGSLVVFQNLSPENSLDTRAHFALQITKK